MKSLRPQRALRALAGLVLLGGMAVAPASNAQTAPADPHQAAAAERAQREADKVYKWILIHADKPKRPAEAKPVPATVPAPAPAPKAVARAKGEGITERATPLEATRPAANPAAAVPVPGTGSQTTELAVAAPVPAGSNTVPAARTPSEPSGSLALAPSTTAEVPKPEPEEDAPLVLVHQVEPEFPAAVLRRLQKGSVQVRFDVQPDGSVTQPEVVKSSHAKLNPAALEAVAQWKFQPLRHAQHGLVELVFNLE